MARNSKQKKKKLMKTLLIAIGVLTVGAAAAYIVNAEQYKTKFMPGIEVNGHKVAEYTVEELEQQLDSEAKTYSLNLKFLNDNTEKILSKDIELEYNCSEELQEIMDSQNRYSWLAGVFGASAAFDLETGISYSKEMLKEELSKLDVVQPENMTAPKDAGITCTDDLTFEIVPETNGNTIDIDKLVEAAAEAIESGETELNVVTADDIYKTPNVRSGDQELIDRLDRLNSFVNKTVTVKLSSGKEQTIAHDDLVSWVSVNSEGLYEIVEDDILEKCREYVDQLAEKDDNYGYYREFDSTYLGTVKLKTDSLHGHRLDRDIMTDKLYAAVMADTDSLVEMEYRVFIDHKDPRFGGTYIEIDIYDQRVFYYIDGELYYDCNCVTGLEGAHSTPSGIFAIQTLTPGRTLEGYNSDGSLSYSAYVYYWMCFYPSYGLHDATWRGSFGGDIYTYDGSHGCVNLSYNSAAKIYERLEYDTPVIVFRGSDDVVIPEEDIIPETDS